jgi:very-short-patch-repair endonuclease
MPSLRARELRRNATDAERKLWYQLRRRQVEGFRFRRQVPLGPYIVDFACLSAKLIVELDGGQHGEDENIAKDAKRTAWLNGQGFRVLRFWNLDVLQAMEGVWDAIAAALAESGGSPHPNPPPQGGRGYE